MKRIHIVISLLLLTSSSLLHADDIFLKLDGIHGGSNDPQYDHSSEVDEWQWNVVSENDGKEVCTSGLRVVKRHDRASPKISEAVAMGRTFYSASIYVRTADDLAQEYIIVNLLDVGVSEYSFSQQDGAASESFLLTFQEMEGNFVVYGQDGRKAGVNRWTFIPSCKQ